MRNWADKEDKAMDTKMVLIQKIFQDPGQEWVRVVVRKQKRKEILDAGHRRMAGGILHISE